ncbi:MAG: tape measure protein, partial [Waterburya sp.]
KIWHKYGTEITLGLILGLASYNGRLKSSSEKVAFLLNESFKKIEGINSPSRVWMQYGRDLIDGLMQGVRTSNASGRQLAQNFNNTFIAPSSDKIKQLKRELQDLYQQKGTVGVISHPVIKDLLVNSAGLAGSAYGADFGDIASLGGDLAGALLARNITNAGISATSALSQIQNTDLFDTLKQLLTHIAEEHQKIGTELKSDILGWAVGNGGASAINLAANSLDTVLPGIGSIASVPLKGSLVAQAIVPQLLKTMERNGRAMGQGLTSGINSQTKNATSAATNLANNTNQAFLHAQQIQSPSKKWKGYGSDIVKGFVIGLGNSRSIGEQYAANFNAGFNKKNFKLDPLTIDVKAIRVYDELIGQQQRLLPEYSDNSMTPEKVRERAARRASERERIRRDLGINLKPQLLLPEYSEISMTPEKVRERAERRAAERERIRRNLGINLKPQPALSDIDKELKRLKEQLKDKPKLGLIEQLNYLLAKLALVKEKFKEAIPYKAENIQDKIKQFTAKFSENKEYLTGKILTFKLDAEPIKNKINDFGSSIANSNIGKNISYLWSKIQTARLKISEEIDYIIAKGKTVAKEQFEAIRYGKPSNKARILPDPSTDPDLTDSVIRTEQALKAYEVEVQKLESQVRAKTEGRKLGGKILDILKDVVIVGFGIKAIRGLIQGTFGILGEIIQSQLLDLRTLINKGIEFQQLKIKLSFITPDGQSPIGYLESIKTKANSSGVDLTQYANNIVAFDRATLNTPIAGQSQDIYERFSKGLAGMPRESQQNALIAVTQIAAKGKVSLEELNGQLSETMPGALSSAAKAMGVTNGELIKMVANGDVLSEDLLPKLAQQLEIESLPKLASSIDSGAFALNELNNEFTIFQGQLGEVALTASKPFMGGLSGTLKTLNQDIGSLINVAIAASSVMTVYFAQSFLRLSGLVDKATGSFIGFTKAGEFLKTA